MSQIRDITGQTFGDLTALFPVQYVPKRKSVLWRCKCKCGRFVDYLLSTLTIGKAKCCGKCDYRSRISRHHNITNQRFGKLVAIHPLKEMDPKRGTIWHCKCDCGNEIDTPLEYLVRGYRKSCGCYNTTDRVKYKTEEEKILRDKWKHMMQRCYLKTCDCYDDYGGRGIQVCEEWRNSKRAFIDWGLKSGFKKGLELNRINNNGNYCPENCNWETDEGQANNRRNSRFLKVDDLEMTCGRWDRYLGLNPGNVWWRFNQTGKDATEKWIAERLKNK